MSIFDGQRLGQEIFRIEVDKIRRGWYSDKYFANNVLILETLAKENYTFRGDSDIGHLVDCSKVQNGDIVVEMQFFTRRKPFCIAAGVDEALAILKTCTGYFDEQGEFVNTYHELEVEAVQDGTFIYYDGDVRNVKPALKIRGVYRYFAKLETVLLGVMAEPTRIATNVYNVLVASRNKEVLFFPARFTHYKMQSMHGYAYSLAIQVFNHKYGQRKGRFVSTDGQGDYWGAEGVGTVAHATICAFLGDTAETMLQFSRILPRDVARIALIDYHNDCISEARMVMAKMFSKYLELVKAKNYEEAEKYELFAVRPDTSGNMRDKSIVPTGNKALDMGVSMKLVWNLRVGLDQAYEDWDLAGEELEMARKWCAKVKICVTGGFDVKKISDFEEQDVPVDIYGVGSTFLDRSQETNNDFTADIVRVKVGEAWYPLAKVGRCACDNPDLEVIQ